MTSTIAAAPAAAAPPVLGPVRRAVVLATLCVTLLVVSVDNTILNVALPSIVRSLGASSSQLQWIVDAYVIVFAGLLLVLGSLGDRVGRKWVFLAGLVVFAAGSATSAFCTTPDRLTAARGFMGIGAAAIMPCTLSILTDVFREPRERARAIGIWSGTTGLGVAIGPVAGGWLLAHYWWGSVFLVNVPIALLGAVAAVVAVPNSRNPASKRPDPVGGVLSIVGMGLLLWGIIEGPERGFGDPLVIGALAGGAGLLCAFVLFEKRSSHPMLELALFAKRRFSIAMTCMGLVILGLMGCLFLLTQYLQFSLGYSALATGLRIAPIAAVLLVVAPASMFVVHHVGTKPVVAVGMVLIAIGLFLLSHVTVHGTYLDVLPAFFFIGTGTGLSFAPSTDAVMGSLPVEESGVGAATNSAFLQVGGALGVGVLGSLLNTRYTDRLTPLLAKYPIPRPILHDITGSLGGALAVAAKVGGASGAELAAAGRSAFVSGMDLALQVGAVIVAVGVVLVVALLPNRPSPPSGPGA